VAVLARLRDQNPGLGENVAIDASDMPAYANGQRFTSKGGRERSDDEFSDPDASWGRRSAVSTRKGGDFYGYRLHMAVDTATDLPLAWRVETARSHETNAVAPLLDKLSALGIDPETCAMDKGYDNTTVYAVCSERQVVPIIPLRHTPDIARGEDKLFCFHGPRRFAGADYKRKATKWRCPTGQCKPASYGSRLTGYTRSSRVRRFAGAASTSDAEPSSASSAGSRTNGRSRRSACVGSSGYSSTPI
jgi:hypothetical protein